MKLIMDLKDNEGVQTEAVETIRRHRRKKRILIISAAFFAGIIIAAALLHSIYVKPPQIYEPPDMYQPSESDASGPGASNENSGAATPAADNRSEGVHVEKNGERKSDYYTFVLCGTDAGEYLTDTIMLASYDVANQRIKIVSVPRDTMLNVTWTVKRVNESYAIGGIERLKEELAGISGFHVDFYATVDLAAFVEIIDAIGGIEYNVPQDMNYSDPKQGLYIDLKAGMQLLNGEKAMELIRFRSYAQGDIQRISVQQSFLKATAAQVLRIGNITKVNEIAEILSKYMDTDLSLGNIIWLGEQMLSLKAADINTSILPGFGGTYDEQAYWLLDAAGVLNVVNENINPYKASISLSDLDIVTLSNGSIISSTGKPVLDPTVGTENAAADPSETAVSPAAPPQPSQGTTPTPLPEMTAEPTSQASPAPTG